MRKLAQAVPSSSAVNTQGEVKLSREPDTPRLAVSLGHTNGVSSVAFAKNGNLALSGGHDGVAILWHVASGTELRRFIDPRGALFYVGLSADGKLAATCGRSGNVYIWDTTNGQKLASYSGRHTVVDNQSPEGGCALSPDGMRLYTTSEGEPHLWNLQTKQPISLQGYVPTSSTPTDEALGGAAFSNDSRLLAASTANALYLWNAQTGQIIWRLHAPTPSNSLAFSPDNKRLLVGATPVLEFDVHTAHPAQFYPGNQRLVLSVAYSPDGRFVASGAWGYAGVETPAARVWSTTSTGVLPTTPPTSTGRLLCTLPHSQIVAGLVFGPHNELVTSCFDSHIRFFDTGTFKQNREMQSGKVNAPLTAGFFHESPFTISTAGDNSAYLWSSAVTQLRHFVPRPRPLFKVDFGLSSMVENSPVIPPSFPPTLLSSSLSADGHTLAAGSEDGVISFWDTDTQRLLSQVGPLKISEGPDAIEQLRLTSDGRKLVANGFGVWIVELTRKRIGEPFTPRVVNFWNLHTEQMSRLQKANASGPSPQPPSELFNLAIGGNTVATVSPDGKRALLVKKNAELWYLSPSSIRYSRRLAPDAINAEFAPDGKSVFVHNTNFLSLYSLQGTSTGKANKPLRLEATSTRLSSARFSADSRTLVTASPQGVVQWYDTTTGQLAGTFAVGASVPLQGRVEVHGISNDRRFALLSSLLEAKVRLLDLRHRRLAAEISTLSDGTWVVADQKGRFDTNNMEGLANIQWLLPHSPYTPYAMEIFMRDYYEPRLLARILSQTPFHDVRPLTHLNRVQPQVRLKVEPLPHTPDQVRVWVTVSTPKPQQTGVYDLHLFRDGQLVGYSPIQKKHSSSANKEGVPTPLPVTYQQELPQWRQEHPIPLTNGKATFSFVVRLPHNGARQYEFLAYAFNRDRIKSSTTEQNRQIYAPPKPLPLRRGRAYLITLGVNATQDPEIALNYAVNDARLFQRGLGTRLKTSFTSIVQISLVSDALHAPKMLFDSNVPELPATKINLNLVLRLLSGHSDTERATILKQFPPEKRRAMEKLQTARPEDLVMLCVSSHGDTDSQGNFYIVPSDIGAAQQHPTQAALYRRCISSEELSLWLRDVDAGEIVMVIDACHSAAAFETPGFKPGPMGSRGLGQLAYNKGIKILAASQAQDAAQELRRLKHGVLTYALMYDGLERRGADTKPRNGKITLDEWLQYGVDDVPHVIQMGLEKAKLLMRKPRIEIREGKARSTTSSAGRNSPTMVKAAWDLEPTKQRRALQQPSLFDFKKLRTEITLQDQPAKQH